MRPWTLDIHKRIVHAIRSVLMEMRTHAPCPHDCCAVSDSGTVPVPFLLEHCTAVWGLVPSQRTSRSDSERTSRSDPNGPTAQVEIYIGPGAKKQLDIDRQLEHEFTEVAGLGDEAWQEPGMIFARTGQDWVSIRVVTLSDPAAFVTPLQSAMRVALGRR